MSATTPEIPTAKPQRGFLDHVLYVLGENPITGMAFGLFAVIVLVAILGPVLAPYDPMESNAARALQPPSIDHWFGTDNLGRDVFSRVLIATRLDLMISVAAVALSFVVGAGIVAALGNTVENIIYATAIINLPFYARVARAEVRIRRNAGFAQAARLSGNTDVQVLAFHIFPNALPPMMVQISLNMGWAILNAAGLSFIGLGVRPPTAEWGIMVAEGANFVVSGEWWLAFFPGLALMTAVFAFNLLGDGLRDIFDPRQRT